MSELKGKVGPRNLTWKTVPRGTEGTGHVEVDGKLVEVRWRKDPHGIWIELPHGVFGFDFEGERSDEGSLQYLVTQRSSDGVWSGVSFLRAGEESLKGAEGGKKKGTRVRAQMPGKIVRINAQAGQSVEKDQSVMVMEAMKMENEIRAPQAGKLGKIAVVVGQAIETGADLFVVDPE